MKTTKDKERFIELRAGGMSFAKIAEAIGVSKPTLIKWNLEFSKEIENRRFFEIEELLEGYRLLHVSRIKTLVETLAKAHEELSKRDFSLVSFKDLLGLVNHLEEKLVRLGGTVRYTTDQWTSFWDSMDNENRQVTIELVTQK